MQKKSEFPESRMTKIGKRIGWIFSPLLFIALLVYTFFSAQGLKFDLTTGEVEKTGFIDLKELTDADVYFDNIKVGKSTTVLTTDKTNANQDPLNIKVSKSSKLDWQKSIKPKEGFVTILYPMMYPQNLKFDYDSFNALNTFATDNPNIFFYEKIENGKLNLYKYNVQKQLFGILIRNDKFADLTSTLVKNTSLNSVLNGTTGISASVLKEHFISSSFLGRSVVVSVPGERAFLFEDSGRVLTIPNYTPQKSDEVFWSVNGDYVFFKSGNDIISVETNTNTVSIIYRASNNETVSIQFITENSIVYKTVNTSTINLIENTFQGNNQQTIDFPNFDGLRKNNLKAAYNMIEKLNLILLQNDKNIYSYNLTTYEMKKLNKFDGEQIIFHDPLKQIVVTMNDKAKNQFRVYNLEQEDSKTFTLEDIDNEKSPENVLGFNSAQGLMMQYESKIKIMDNDGSNQVNFTDGNDLRNVLAVKADRNVVFVISSSDKTNLQNPLQLRVARFEN